MIDPKKIEEWKALVRVVRACQAEGGPDTDDESLPVVAANAIEALLAEREEMLRQVSEARTTLRDAARALDPERLSDAPLAMLAKAVRGTHDVALAMLREVAQKSRDLGDDGDLRERIAALLRG